MKAKFKSNGLLSESPRVFLGGGVGGQIRSAYFQYFQCLWKGIYNNKRCIEPKVTYQVYEDSLYELYNLYNKGKSKIYIRKKIVGI